MEKKDKGNYYELVADKNKYITQADINEIDKVFAEIVYTTTLDLWTEWTQEQKEQWEDQHQEIDEIN